MSLDTWLLQVVSVDLKNGILDAVMPVISRPGPFLIPAVVSLLGLGVIGGRKGRRTVLVLLLAFLVSDFMCGRVLKPLVHRPRPVSGKPESFPSCHASNCFAAAAALIFAYRTPFVAGPACLVAGAVGYSRVYLKAHYPTDVLAGALLGTGWGLLFSWGASRLASRRKRKGSGP